MIKNEGPYDLNIPVKCARNTTPTALVKRALALGYRTVALNVSVSQSQFLTKKQAKNKNQPESNILPDFPPPPSVTLTPDDYPDLAARGLKPTILTRLTISIMSNEFLLHYNKSVTAKQYCLLAIDMLMRIFILRFPTVP